jgi:2-polyprenyl-6-methoxyphenol hydroxylase-like FAD-dependent oxidoreductase
MLWDVAIAGAGIAGSALAIELGRCGYSVAVFERSHFPREKPCGEGLMPAGVAALEELGLDTQRLGAAFQGIRYHFHERVAEGHFPGGSAGGVTGRGMRRRDLDAALANLAAQTKGVELHTGLRASGPLVEQGRVTGLLVEDQPVRARLVVAADGAQSRMRHALGLNSPVRRKRIGMRMHFRQVTGVPAQTHVEIFLGLEHDLYVTPLPGGEFLVAALVEAEALRGRVEEEFRRWWEAQPLLAPRIRNAEPASELLVTSPLTGRARRRVLPGFVLLGDAAGFTDPITGGGMTQALQTARLLAGHLAAARDWSEAALEAFDREREMALLDYRRVTAGVLWLARHPQLIRPALDLMSGAPAFFSHLLGVTGGVRRLFRPAPKAKISSSTVWAA